MKPLAHLTALGISLTPLAFAQNNEAPAPSKPEAIAVVSDAPPASPEAKPETEAPEKDPAVENLAEVESLSNSSKEEKPKTSEQETLSAENKLAAERLLNETNAIRAQITRLKMERELISEKLALQSVKLQAELSLKLEESETEKAALQNENELSKLRAEKLTNDLKSLQAESALKVTRLQSEIADIETTDKRSQYADSTPVYLEHPLRDDGILVISDRRISLNGTIVSSTADYVTSRIDYWNNKDSKLPIFIVINNCPGGSVMAGYRILKSMEASEAPIHVVVKSFAASMAACITTLAEESYAYPNAIILHHQISSQLTFANMNLTQQKEFYEDSNRWWERLATPVATKMGISTDEFIKRMYKQNTSGDWSEFGDQAVKLKWVNHIIKGVDETSFTRDPDSQENTPNRNAEAQLTEQVDEAGHPFVYLPRLNPKDVYFLYNPDSYYRVR
ncbi:ATP-dependent Clp protease proteolytic subunit [Luteolibacter pohnpeiensis]|uniref:ATP-dependent Clp protease proteolytic subunit n=1 Tax=Luteolibacter pohnpeiensis TaxID=454153 RepID=A0A934VPD6_9BACT|nr:ATP-dependent Clp protease proteolytic subunit [Luteolibacter pohnpeiensis]MBK1880881.1 ATP-dependent Clp protease proteolytic subunit [Luteolibacter pohnpeiensis]